MGRAGIQMRELEKKRNAADRQNEMGLPVLDGVATCGHD
jgi:hypothetical protein